MNQPSTGAPLVTMQRTKFSATVTLQRQEVRNAFNEPLIEQLTHALLQLAEDSDLRAVTLAGAGSVFCAGADLEWMRRSATFTREQNVADARRLHRLLDALYNMPAVTIARVQGAAMGGGAGLVAACDAAVAEEGARFAFSEVRLGLAPAVIAPYVVEKVGSGAARTLCVTGVAFTAQEALRIGLVARVVPATDLDAATAEFVAAACQAGPHAVRTTRQLLRDISGMNPADAVDITVDTIAGLRVGAEGREGIAAFLDKRPPGFAKLPGDGG